MGSSRSRVLGTLVLAHCSWQVAFQVRGLWLPHPSPCGLQSLGRTSCLANFGRLPWSKWAAGPVSSPILFGPWAPTS